MSDIIISVEQLSKSYLVGHQSADRTRTATIRDTISREVRDFARKTVDFLNGRPILQGNEVEEFWALKDVTFDVRRGEVLGIIGRNGAGKSTLLKILSRITEPTRGRVTLRGRIASLLEVGTGFHQELTGRENIFLNGAILGMSHAEIVRKFDEIVAFAGVERFIDTPVKRYSSGMYVRLAFAVAAHLEPEILVIDEVLAVGDSEFQKRCLGKMDEVSRREGRTILLVSHDLAAISELTHRTLLLDSGHVVVDGLTNFAVSAYISKGHNASVYEVLPGKQSRRPHISRAEVVTSDGAGIHRFGEPFEIKVCVDHDQPISKGCLSVQIVNQFEQCVIHAWAFHPEVQFATRAGGSFLTCRFPSLRLNVGQFHLRTHLSETPNGEFYERLDGICPFEVIRTDKTILWGWRPEDCVYHEQWQWTVDADYRTVTEELE
jgi:lipopolysaccharide transport system ATP-binding protein